MNIQTHIAEKIEALQSEPDTIAVLQGVPLPLLPDDVRETFAAIDWAGVLANPIGYFSQQIVGAGRHVLLMEEYRLLRAFLVDQFQEIVLLWNNVYIHMQPVAALWPAPVRTALLAHFDEDAKEDTDVRTAERAMKIYGSLFEQDGCLYATYVDEGDEAQVFRTPLFDGVVQEPPIGPATTVRNVLEEADYLSLVREVMRGELTGEIGLRITDYAGEKERLLPCLMLLASVTGTSFFLAEEAAPSTSFQHRPVYAELLKRYWHADAFRTFRVYDLAALSQGKKRLCEVSQEAVIARLVQEVEACGRGAQPRDLFVTAPTGAGKSAMFQIPAMVLAQEAHLMTLVISPLIGLMNDQVAGLEGKHYAGAKTINSDISPIEKQDIMAKVKDGTYNILYLSPESLLARSDVEQLIGDRTIGMIVVDEAHIVTTWGKQFRPDYWYLGDHIRKLRKRQIKEKGQDFVVAAFTATAIYGGREDMYLETVDSLHMIEPVTYLGYVRRSDDIHITIEPMEAKGRNEYELDKFRRLEELIDGALCLEAKTLIYFPTVRLIRAFYEHLGNSRKKKRVATYYGTMNRLEKQAAYEAFRTGAQPVMLATKAFGMGIDIDDIENIIHFAPTGNVCDYVQEIGRAARRDGLEGEAFYPYNQKDFRYINRLQGMSAIRTGQLIGVIKKLVQTYDAKRRSKKQEHTKKKNAVLIDAENFAYLFDTVTSDQDDAIAKVKTALLLIQKDFERRRGFSPMSVRPIPLFGNGYFSIVPEVQRALQRAYPGTVEEKEAAGHFCSVDLKAIWEAAYQTYSFPQFKYEVYSRNKECSFNQQYAMQPAFCVQLAFGAGGIGTFWDVWKPLKDFIYRCATAEQYCKPHEIAAMLRASGRLKSYETEAFVDVLISSMDTYASQMFHGMQPLFRVRPLRDGGKQYLFYRSVQKYFRWVEKYIHVIMEERQGARLFLSQEKQGERCRSVSVVLGLLEALNVLSFEMKGGEESKLYIYMYQTEPLRNIIRQPKAYHNRLLEEIYARHKISVAMLRFLYEGGFTSEEIWDYLEDYFLGKVPEEVTRQAFESSAGR